MDRPTMRYVGEDGNIFHITGRAGGVLLRAGLREQRNEMYRRVSAATSYHEALGIVMEYVAPEGEDDEEEGD